MDRLSTNPISSAICNGNWRLTLVIGRGLCAFTSNFGRSMDEMKTLKVPERGAWERENAESQAHGRCAETSGSARVLDENDVHIWSFPLDAPADLLATLGVNLSGEERQRAT